MRSDPPRAKSVTVTIFGDSIAPHGGEVWLGSLIELLEPFGINDRLVRTSVFRLAEEGWLNARRDGRRSAYRLTAPGTRRFERAHRRIYSRERTGWEKSWTILLAPANAISAGQRNALKKELLWEGFGLISPGIFFHPAANQEALDEILGRLGIREKVFVSTATETNRFATRPLSDLIEVGWELGPVITGYQNFIKRFTGLLEIVQSGNSVKAQPLFVIRTLLIHSFRRVMLHDPGLPIELLPSDWPGHSAYDLCRTIYRLTQSRAEEHLLSTLRREDPKVPRAASYFYQRFGGLK